MRQFAIYLFLVVLLAVLFFFRYDRTPSYQAYSSEYWLLLHRRSNREYLYKGKPGEPGKSRLIREFAVKSGEPGKKPTPLPQLVGRGHWLIIDKLEAKDNPETAPYFLVLDVPIPSEEPFGPKPYTECDGQCNWQVPGYFGLHGVAGDESKMSAEDPGSSGCVRHTDEDITYLYNLFDPKSSPVHYYIEDI